MRVFIVFTNHAFAITNLVGNSSLWMKTDFCWSLSLLEVTWSLKLYGVMKKLSKWIVVWCLRESSWGKVPPCCSVCPVLPRAFWVCLLLASCCVLSWGCNPGCHLLAVGLGQVAYLPEYSFPFLVLPCAEHVPGRTWCMCYARRGPIRPQ